MKETAVKLLCGQMSTYVNEGGLGELSTEKAGSFSSLLIV